MGRRYTKKKPILSEDLRRKLDTGGTMSGLIPDPTSQKISIGLKSAALLGDRIRQETTTTDVRGHYRIIYGRKVRVRYHRRRIKKKFSFRL